MKDLKKIVVILALSLTASIVQALPAWTVDASAFSNTMTITGIVTIAGTELNSANDMVGAFVGTECRGVAHLLPSTVLGHSYAYLVIYSNEKAETVHFKVFQSSTDSIITLANSYMFVSDASVGTQAKPYIFSETAVNGSAIETIRFGVKDEEITIDKSLKTVAITFPDGTDLTSVTSTITTSAGSLATVNGDVINTSTTFDLTKPMTIIVTAQDGTTSNWTIEAKLKTGIAELENAYDVRVLPNGTVRFVGFPETAIYSIYTLTGQCIVESKTILENFDFGSIVKQPLVITVRNTNRLLLSKIIITK